MRRQLILFHGFVGSVLWLRGKNGWPRSIFSGSPDALFQLGRCCNFGACSDGISAISPRSCDGFLPLELEPAFAPSLCIALKMLGFLLLCI